MFICMCKELLFPLLFVVGCENCLSPWTRIFWIKILQNMILGFSMFLLCSFGSFHVRLSLLIKTKDYLKTCERPIILTSNLLYLEQTYPKCFWPKIYFWPKNFFLTPKNILTKKIFEPKKFNDQNKFLNCYLWRKFFDQHFLTTFSTTKIV